MIVLCWHGKHWEKLLLFNKNDDRAFPHNLPIRTDSNQKILSRLGQRTNECSRVGILFQAIP